MIRYVVISLLFFSLLGCTSKETACEFYDGFAFYMKNEHHIDISQKASKVYYLMPMSGCEPCVASNLEMLASIPKSENLLIVFINTSDDEQYNIQAKQLKQQHYFLEDRTGEIHSYETNFGKPLLIHIDKEKCKAYDEITDLKVEEAKNYLLTNHE